MHVRNQQFKLYRDGRFFDVASDPNEENPLDANSLDSATASTRDLFQRVLQERAAAVVPVNTPPAAAPAN